MSSLLPPPRLLLADNSRIRYRASVRHIPYRSPTHDHAPEVQAHEAQSSRSAPPPLFWAYPIPPPPSALRYAELRYRLGNSDQAPVPLGPRWGSGTETWLPVTFPGWAALASGTNGLYRVRDIDLCAPSRFCDLFFLAGPGITARVGERWASLFEARGGPGVFSPPPPGRSFIPAMFTSYKGHLWEVSGLSHASIVMQGVQRSRFHGGLQFFTLGPQIVLIFRVWP